MSAFKLLVNKYYMAECYEDVIEHLEAKTMEEAKEEVIDGLLGNTFGIDPYEIEEGKCVILEISNTFTVNAKELHKTFKEMLALKQV